MDKRVRVGPLTSHVIARVKARHRWNQIADFLFGVFLYDTVRTLRRQRGDIENLFVLVLFGDMLGVPILPPYYALRLLPFTVPSIRGWRYRLLRERDITDLIG